MTPERLFSDENKESSESASVCELQHSISGFAGITSGEKLQKTFSCMVTRPPVTSLLLPTHSSVLFYVIHHQPALTRSDIAILKNTPEVNAMLWKVKHLVKVTPIRLSVNQLIDVDPHCCFLKVSFPLHVYRGSLCLERFFRIVLCSIICDTVTLAHLTIFYMFPVIGSAVSSPAL
ncbi:hypothetical protein E2C01_041934 [Portunus trituberculatus]|uniref:39S ribosomal protein L30, mitochondrial n=1 Tax=Portunus trituberculatus TaxID=210409 RepID=A0A5B7FRP5_PORTR|nr:hypothetical protein [Portunus trituberculatus]